MNVNLKVNICNEPCSRTVKSVCPFRRLCTGFIGKTMGSVSQYVVVYTFRLEHETNV